MDQGTKIKISKTTGTQNYRFRKNRKHNKVNIILYT